MDKKNRATRAARRSALILFLGVALSGFMFLEAALAPKADPWPRWQAFEAASTAVIDHSPWDQFLKKYLKPGPGGVNRVAYGKERVILSRRGRDLAAIVPLEDVELLEALEDRLDLDAARAALKKAGKVASTP